MAEGVRVPTVLDGQMKDHHGQHIEGRRNAQPTRCQAIGSRADHRSTGAAVVMGGTVHSLSALSRCVRRLFVVACTTHEAKPASAAGGRAARVSCGEGGNYWPPQHPPPALLQIPATYTRCHPVTPESIQRNPFKIRAAPKEEGQNNGQYT
jgi:hypothetical protein